jgi:enoyl-CoA hydratase/carnithine racemase
MAEGAKLTTAFAKRGLIAEHGSSWMLPRLIGPMNALDLLYSARMVHAAEAERLVAGREFSRRRAIDRTRSGYYAVAALDRRDQTASLPVLFPVARRSLSRADAEMLASFGSEDFKEGVAHFVEKRAAAFSGR